METIKKQALSQRVSDQKAELDKLNKILEATRDEREALAGTVIALEQHRFVEMSQDIEPLKSGRFEERFKNLQNDAASIYRRLTRRSISSENRLHESRDCRCVACFRRLYGAR